MLTGKSLADVILSEHPFCKLVPFPYLKTDILSNNLVKINKGRSTACILRQYFFSQGLFFCGWKEYRIKMYADGNLNIYKETFAGFSGWHNWPLHSTRWVGINSGLTYLPIPVPLILIWDAFIPRLFCATSPKSHPSPYLEIKCPYHYQYNTLN